jgi:hypothetical protein
MKVWLDGICARPCDLVAEREGSKESDGRPAMRVKRATDQGERTPEEDKRQEVSACEQRRERQPCDAHEPGEDFVEQHQARLRFDKLAVSRERLRIDRMRDRGDIERLVGDPVAVAGAVGSGEENKEHQGDQGGQDSIHREIWEISL